MRELARMISVLLSIYNMLIIIRIVMLWLKPMGGEQEGGFSEFLGKIVDPFLNLFRNIRVLQRGRIDFTPLVAFLTISFFQRILSTFAYTGKLSVGIILSMILQTLWGSIGSIIIGLFAILVGVRLYVSYKPSPKAIQYIAMIDAWIRKPLDLIHRYILQGREASDRYLLWATLITTFVVYIVTSIVINIIANLLLRIPF